MPSSSPASPMSDWFEHLFGFVEGDYEWTQSQFGISEGVLSSKHTDKTFIAGSFSTPTLSELRGQATPNRNNSKLAHVVVGDALELHARPEHAGDMFQVASQFNALEFADPEMTPEDGVTDYARDLTQGPACSIAAAAGTVHRNYLVDLHGQLGQNRRSQINNLQTLESKLKGGPYWTVNNGYIESEVHLLVELAAILDQYDRNELLGTIRIAIQEQTQVTFSNRFQTLEPPHLVSQAFCSAVSCAYSAVETALWEPIATLILEAAYEGTLIAAANEGDRGTGSGTVWLTFLGGGVFGNKPAWIATAIEKALKRTKNLGLDIRICHFQALQTPYKDISLA